MLFFLANNPLQISLDEIDLALSNPDYAQLSNTYPPKILLTVSHVPVQGKLPDDCCDIGVNGIIEDHAKFTLRFPSHPSSDPVHVPPDQPKGKCIHGHQNLACVNVHTLYANHDATEAVVS